MSHSPAGWYPDADGVMRYWDGLAWTEPPMPQSQGSSRAGTTIPVPQGMAHTTQMPTTQMSTTQMPTTQMPTTQVATAAPVFRRGPSAADLAAQARAGAVADEGTLTFTSGARDGREWFQRKRFLVPGGLAALLVVGLLLTGGDDPTPSASPVAASASSAPAAEPTDDPTPSEVPTVGASTPTDEPTDEATEGGEETSPFVTYNEAFGTFSKFSKKGRGDGVVRLPSGVSAALVRVTHDGESNFGVQVLDENNQPTADLLVNVVGSYRGTTAYGFNDFGAAPAKLRILADGAWSVTISPIASAPKFDGSASGTGDRVFRYDGDPASVKIRHRGEANFSVLQIGQGYPDLLVNEVGEYDGTVPLSAGPSVLTIKADGDWSIRKD